VKKLIYLAILLGGCSWSEFVERTSTERFTGPETEPFAEEAPRLDNGRTGITKLLTIHNPLPFDIDAYVVCHSMWNDDPTIRVKAHTSKFLFVGASHSQEHTQSCFLNHYAVIYPQAK
jgi:hypothetical protein